MSTLKRMTILRGLPGSGKSTYARGLGGTVLGSDDYFMVGEVYRWEKARQALAHEWNQDRARKACEAGDPHVIIDNTNTRLWEMEPYKSIARACGYEIHTHVMRGGETWNPQACFERNLHGVPLSTIIAMHARFEWERLA